MCFGLVICCSADLAGGFPLLFGYLVWLLRFLVYGVCCWFTMCSLLCQCCALLFCCACFACFVGLDCCVPVTVFCLIYCYDVAVGYLRLLGL